MKKKFQVKMAIAAALFASASPAVLLHQASADNADFDVQLAQLNIQIEGQTFDVPGGKTPEGDTYVGLAFLSSRLGLTTDWDEATKTVTVSGPNKKMSMHNQSTEYALNNHKFYASQPPVILEGTTYLPLRFLLEQMGYQIGYQDASQTITISKIQENELRLSNVSDQHEMTEKQRFTAQYPQVDRWSDSAAAEKINTFIQSEIAKYRATFDKEMNEFADRPDDVYTLDVNYEITFNQNNTLSLYFDVYTYQGGAHGNTTRDAHTFDLNTGDQLTLEQLTGHASNYKDFINQEIKRQLKEAKIDFVPFETIDDSTDFGLRGDSLVLYLELNQYVGALGIQEFAIPLSAFSVK